MMMLYVFEIKLKLLMRPYKKPEIKKEQKLAPRNNLVKKGLKILSAKIRTNGEILLASTFGRDLL